MQPLLQVVSIAPSGRITQHWQLKDLPTARRLAAAVEVRLKFEGTPERVAIWGTVEVVKSYTFEIGADGEFPEIGPEVFNGEVGC